MANVDKVYKNLIDNIVTNGDKKPAARAGMPGSTSLFAQQIQFDLREEFPILTTKKVSFKNIKTELLWFLKGETSIKYLIENGCNIWNDDAYRHFIGKVKDEFGDDGQVDLGFKQFFLGRADNPFNEAGEVLSKNEYLERIKDTPRFETHWGILDLVYPYQWRNFGGEVADNSYYSDQPGVDQIKEVLSSLKNQPFGRRHIVTAWNPQDVPHMGLPACHAFVQFNVAQFGETFYLDCALTQRSADSVLGIPYNITSYALLTHLFAKILGYTPRYLSMVLNDAHVYDNHMEAVEELLTRDVTKFSTPDLEFSGVFDEVDKYWLDDAKEFDIDGFLEAMGNRNILFKTDYESYPAIKALLSVGV